MGQQTMPHTEREWASMVHPTPGNTLQGLRSEHIYRTRRPLRAHARATSTWDSQQSAGLVRVGRGRIVASALGRPLVAKSACRWRISLIATANISCNFLAVVMAPCECTDGFPTAPLPPDTVEYGAPRPERRFEEKI